MASTSMVSSLPEIAGLLMFLQNTWKYSKDQNCDKLRRGDLDVMVTIAWNGERKPSSNPDLVFLYFT